MSRSSLLAVIVLGHWCCRLVARIIRGGSETHLRISSAASRSRAACAGFVACQIGIYSDREAATETIKAAWRPTGRSCARACGKHPTFDVARMSPMAMPSLPGELRLASRWSFWRDGEVHDRTMTDSAGALSSSAKRLPPGNYDLALRVTKPDGRVVQSKGSVAVTLNACNGRQAGRRAGGATGACRRAVKTKRRKACRHSHRYRGSQRRWGALCVGHAALGSSVRLYLNDAVCRTVPLFHLMARCRVFIRSGRKQVTTELGWSGLAPRAVCYLGLRCRSAHRRLCREKIQELRKPACLSWHQRGDVSKSRPPDNVMQQSYHRVLPNQRDTIVLTSTRKWLFVVITFGV